MSDKQQFDLLIVGSGEAGKNLAWTMSKAGRRAAVIERKLIGGSCPNIACMPSKNVIHSAKVAELARRGLDPSDRVTITIEPDELIPGRHACRARVIAAGLTDDDIDRLIDEARSEAQPLLG